MTKKSSKKKIKRVKAKELDFKKFMKQPIKKAAKRTAKLKIQNRPDFTKRIKLTPVQLEEVKASSGNGASAKFTEEGKLSLELVKRLNLAKRHADKFILACDAIGRRFFISHKEALKSELKKDEAAFVTFNPKQALIFYMGFDDPQVKIDHFNKLYNQSFFTVKV